MSGGPVYIRKTGWVSGDNLAIPGDDVPVPVKITGASSVVGDTITGDSGQNAQLMAPNRKEVAFSTAIVAAVGTTDVSNYRWASVQIVTQGGSSTVTFQVSNDNINWQTLAMVAANNTGNAIAVGASTTAGIWFGPVLARYFRLNVTGIASGTTAGVIEFFSEGGGIANPSVGVGTITTAVVPGTAATNLGKAEDAGHVTADTGVFILGVRNDAATVLSSTDADYSAIATDGVGRVQTLDTGTYTHINSNTTTTAKSGVGVLVGIAINTKGATANTATVFDNTAGSGTVIAVIDTTTAVGFLKFGCRFATGLTVVTATGTAADLTVITA